MTRRLLVLWNDAMRAKAHSWIDAAEKETRVTFQEPKRTLPQNDRMWAMLTDISAQKKHVGRIYTPDQWKVLFLHAAGRETQFIPALDNSTFIPWGQSSSDLSVNEMADLITFMEKWGGDNGVKFNGGEP